MIINLFAHLHRLATIVAPPRVVTELSWVNKYWQMALSVAGQPLQQPEVHRYCLMGVKDSFTDFHIDFGGTSVWYHVLRVSESSGQNIWGLYSWCNQDRKKALAWCPMTYQISSFFNRVYFIYMV